VPGRIIEYVDTNGNVVGKERWTATPQRRDHPQVGDVVEVANRRWNVIAYEQLSNGTGRATVSPAD
jgi:hypothetical protein